MTLWNCETYGTFLYHSWDFFSSALSFTRALVKIKQS